MSSLRIISIKAHNRFIAGSCCRLRGVLFACFLVYLIAIPAQAKYDYGTGEPNNPYRISDANNMNEIGLHPEDWGAHFLLVNDINLIGYTGTQFNIIGTSGSNTFTGVFDGNGHSISNFTYASTGTSYIGIFGCIYDVSAVVKDLELIDPNVSAGTGYYVGALVGAVYGGTISNCCSNGVVSGADEVGGLVGHNNGMITDCNTHGEVLGTADNIGGLVGYNAGTIKYCYSSSDVWGDDDVGGLIGDNSTSIGPDEVSDCCSSGNVEGDDNIGGLVGNNYGPLTNCYSNSDVTGDRHIGGLAGDSDGPLTNCSSSGTVVGTTDYIGGLVGDEGTSHPISQCFSISNVSGRDRVGGLVGNDSSGKIENSYSGGNVSGRNIVGGLVGRTYECNIVNSYSSGTLSGTDSVGGLVGSNNYNTISSSFWDEDIGGHDNGYGIGKTTTEMKDPNTFIDAGWDFVGESTNGDEEIWRLCVKGTAYPMLEWQFILGDFVCPDGVDFVDYAFFAQHWLDTNCADSNDCQRTDFNESGTVDLNDLSMFVDNWLAGK